MDASQDPAQASSQAPFATPPPLLPTDGRHAQRLTAAKPMASPTTDPTTDSATDPARRPWPTAWPAPALLTWLVSWVLLKSASGLGNWLAWALALGLGLVVALAMRGAPVWRRLIVVAGFPVSAGLKGIMGLAGLASGWATGTGSHPPAWAWLLPAALLLAVYPLRAWRDAPMFPTPERALQGLGALVPLPAGARLLDAGCGLGHGLWALRAEYPTARFEGIEWSWLLQRVGAVRCPWARLRRGDMWRADWSGYALVYLFQRPESMARALAKAEAEMAPGAWLASLEFAAPKTAPAAVLRRAGAKPVWLYRVGAGDSVGLGATQPPADCVAAQSAPNPADNPLNKPAQPGRR